MKVVGAHGILLLGKIGVNYWWIFSCNVALETLMAVGKELIGDICF